LSAAFGQACRTTPFDEDSIRAKTTDRPLPAQVIVIEGPWIGKTGRRFDPKICDCNIVFVFVIFIVPIPDIRKRDPAYHSSPGGKNRRNRLPPTTSERVAACAAAGKPRLTERHVTIFRSENQCLPYQKEDASSKTVRLIEWSQSCSIP